MTSVKDAKRIVFKVGTSTLTYATGKANLRRLSVLARVLSDLHNAGKEVVLVSSGAIGVGVGKLGLGEKPADTPGRQAAACVGQCELMFIYDKLFGEYGNTVGQLLLTKSDVEDPERHDNLINTFDRLFAFGAIPIVNENDAVAVEEIVYGDNDQLSAIVAKLIGADLLVILSDIDGMFTANPQTDPEASLIPVIPKITPEVYAMAGGAGSKRGTGGMTTKIAAAEIAAGAGVQTVIMNGSDPLDIYKLTDGHSIGTLFRAE